MAVLYLQLSFAIFTLTTVVGGYRSKNEQYFTVGREIEDAKSYDFIRGEYLMFFSVMSLSPSGTKSKFFIHPLLVFNCKLCSWF